MSIMDQFEGINPQLDHEKIALENQILERAMHVFWEYGYDGTNYNQLVAATGLSRKAIYKRWHDKQTLYTKCMSLYSRHMSQVMLYDVTDKNGSGLPALHQLFKRIRTNLLDDSSYKGCLIIKSMQHLNEDQEVSKLALGYLGLIKGGLYNSLDIAKRTGQIAQDTNEQHVVEFLFAVYISVNSVAPSNAAKHLMKVMIDQAIDFIDNIATRPLTDEADISV